MLVNLGDKPLAGFGEPLEMLKDCHRRIEYFLDSLRSAEQRFGEGELPEEGRRALEAAAKYFAEFAPRHTADEEASLFPRLRTSQSSEAREAVAQIDRLESDHRDCDKGHATVDTLVRRWLAEGRIDPAQRTLLRSTLAELAKIYAAHIHVEEHQVFEIASRMLAPDELRLIGEEMRQRRSLPKHDAPAAKAGV
jgi:hemerythrin-like domain-containing protein